MPIEYAGILAFVCLIIVLIAGIPIAFGLLGISAILLFSFIGDRSLNILVSSMWGAMNQDIFICLPLYLFMAFLLEGSGIGVGLYDAMYKWMGPLRGGLAVGTVLISAIIAAMSGIGGTAIILMGLLAYPEMRKRRYSQTISLGTVMAGGTLGPLIPPSGYFVLLGVYSGVSVGKLFMGGVVPGILMTILFCAYVLIAAFLKPESAPAISEKISWKAKFISLRGLILPILLILCVLGSIYAGICTPTEAAGFGAFGAIICALINRTFNWAMLKKASLSTFLVTGLMMWLIFGANTFNASLSMFGINKIISDFVTGLSLSNIGLVGIIVLIALILGTIMDSGAILLITIPIFMPLVKLAGIDPLWFCVVFTVSLLTGFITPPFGYAMFYLKSIVGKDATMGEIYRATPPFIIAMFIGLVLLIIFPQIVTWLPGKM